MMPLAKDVLAEGQDWPPEHEKDRLENYVKAQHLLMGKHSEVFTLKSAPTAAVVQQILRFQSPFMGDTGVDSTRTVRTHLSIPLPLIVGIVYGDLMFAEPLAPVLEGAGDLKNLKAIMARSSFTRLNLEQAAVSSVLGDCVYEVYLREGESFIESVEPKFYFPLYELESRTQIREVILAWFVDIDKTEYLRVKVFRQAEGEEGAATLEHQVWVVQNKKLQRRVTLDVLGLDPTIEMEELPTKQIPVVHIPNYTLGERWGISDFGCGTDQMLDELDNRLSQSSSVLDRHADPKIRGPEELMEEEAGTGQSVVDLRAGYIPFRQADVKPEYMTWDGDLEAAEKQVDRILTMIALATGLPVSIFLPLPQGRDQSAKRLRLEFFMAINRCNRKRLYFDSELKRLLLIAQELESSAQKYQPAIVADLGWGDALPQDYEEIVRAEAQRLTVGTQSVVAAIMNLDGIDREAAEQKKKEIDEDQQADLSRVGQAMEDRNALQEEEET